MAVSTVKFNYKLQTRSGITPRKIFMGGLKYILTNVFYNMCTQLHSLEFFPKCSSNKVAFHFFSTILILLLGVLAVQ